jgi:hypothetical protein
MKFLKKNLICLLLFLISFLSGLPGLFEPMNTDGDAYGRLDTAIVSFKYGDWFLMTGYVWLPFHTTFMIFSQLLAPNSPLVPRLENLLVSAVIPVLLYLLTYKLTNHRGASISTAIMCILYPFWRHLSTATLTEPLFLVLLLSSQLFFIKGSYGWFTFFMFLSQATRFEAWFLIPWYLMVFWTQKNLSFQKKTLISFMLILFPVLYSISSFEVKGTAVAYYDDMARMAVNINLPGVRDFPLAILSWDERIWESTPIIFVFLALIGLVAFHAKNYVTKNTSSAHQLIYVLTPIFLVFMLYVQVFLQLRDWFPFRYVFIPTILAFPLMGLGLQWLLQQYPVKRYWPYFLFLVLFFSFEFYSLSLNTERLIANLKREVFSDMHTLIRQINTSHTNKPITTVYLLNTKSLYGEAEMDVPFIQYFLLPDRPNIEIIKTADLVKKTQSLESKNYFLIAKNSARFTPPENMSTLAVSKQYTLYYQR